MTTWLLVLVLLIGIYGVMQPLVKPIWVTLRSINEENEPSDGLCPEWGERREKVQHVVLKGNKADSSPQLFLVSGILVAVAEIADGNLLYKDRMTGDDKMPARVRRS